MASTVELSSDNDPSKPDSLCGRVVTEDPEIDNWIWTIEYLAKFKNELWMLHDVFEMGPKIPDYLGEHTNEMVAFRCLASLFDSSTSLQSKEVVSDANSKIEFDSSESCEYVLQCILDEIPLSELKPGAPGLSKWNLVPFIKSKLLSLPKCALELMIEPSSEKDTGVSPCNGPEGMGTDGKETGQVTSRVADPELMGRVEEERQSFGHGSGNGADEISSSHASLETRDEGFRDESDGHVSILSEKRYRCIQCKGSGKLLFCSSDGCTVMVHERCIVDSPPVYDDAGNFYCSLCALTCMRTDGRETNQVTSRMSDPDLTGRIEEDRRSFGLGPGDGTDDESISRSHTSLERRDEVIPNETDASSPSENRYRCIQCKESGKLLFCSSDGCTVMVHESCVVDSPPLYDDAGNFYCSLCALSCVSAEYLQSQEEVARAKKRLVSFLNLMSDVKKKKSTKEGSSLL
ncbi:unnamed protein product [Thlaspi arvense]|uniref:Zinc finger PHD-type domain-containing protein n=1 Tax=Thlaspi arvense TaxID=13288 RepID=A0AAU9SHH4_THLAR|nr:unnamed protein product [Thlaspi arvense]